jgi:hypothetical protein
MPKPQAQLPPKAQQAKSRARHDVVYFLLLLVADKDTPVESDATPTLFLA